MGKRMWIAVGAIIAAFAILIGVSVLQNKEGALLTPDYSQYDVSEVIPASEYTGGLEENIHGNPDAPVKVFEYADYQCEGCAGMNPYITSMIDEYDGKVAVVFRGYVLSYHENGTAAASAANAAAMQGYWDKYKDALFANQDDWYSAGAKERQNLFEKYFEDVTEGQGDLAKFRQDMNSQAVKQKIAFDRGLTEKVGLEWTPTIYVEDELIEYDDVKEGKTLDVLREKIEKKLAELEKSKK